MPLYYRVNIDGTLCAGAERFSTSFAVTGGQSDPLDQTALNSWAAAAKAYLAGSSSPAQQLRAMLGLVGAITTVRIYRYPDIGQTADLVAQSSSTPAAGSGSSILPPQCALVFSLLTAQPGRRYRGRMYWPVQVTGVNSSGKYGSVNDSMAENVGIMLRTLSEAAPWTGVSSPAVVSQVAGAVTPVTAVSIGDVVDTQRRRRDTILEQRYTVALPA